jgi:hypothetical protein
MIASVVAALGLLVAMALLFAGIKRLSWASPMHALLSGLDLLALGLAVWQLEWLGIALLGVAHLVAFAGWGAAGVIYVDSEVAAAHALGVLDRDAIRPLLGRLNELDSLRPLGPRRRSHLVRLLAERARTAEEIEVMAPPIGLLWTIAHKPDLDWLVERFDTILRLYDETPAQAMRIADSLVEGARQSAATLREMLEAAAVTGTGTAA